MYQKIKSISVPSLCKHKATPFFNINHSKFLEHHACAIFDISIMGKTIAPKGVPHIIIIGNCQSQLEIRMAEKITLFKFLNYMVKPIELNPEWVLSELPQSLYADGNGNISVDTDTITDAKWIKLALNTLLIPYEENEYGDGDMTFIDIEFNLEDLRTECPTLYKKMKEMDAKNKIYKNINLS
jgi:hypothetical protein